jgi:hypothetical protein
MPARTLAGGDPLVPACTTVNASLSKAPGADSDRDPHAPQAARRAGRGAGGRRSPERWRPPALADDGSRPHFARGPDRHRGSRPRVRPGGGRHSTGRRAHHHRYGAVREPGPERARLPPPALDREPARATLFGIRQRAPQLFPRFSTLVVQPVLSIGVCTGEQLRLIAGAASYVQSVTKGAFEVYCSA